MQQNDYKVKIDYTQYIKDNGDLLSKIDNFLANENLTSCNQLILHHYMIRQLIEKAFIKASEESTEEKETRKKDCHTKAIDFLNASHDLTLDLAKYSGLKTNSEKYAFE